MIFVEMVEGNDVRLGIVHHDDHELESWTIDGQRTTGRIMSDFWTYNWHWNEIIKSIPMTSDFDFSAEILFIDIREYLPNVDPDNLTQKNVLEILLYLMNQKIGFLDRGHEENNHETAWINGFLLKLIPEIDENGTQRFIVQCIGSSMDKIALLQ